MNKWEFRNSDEAVVVGLYRRFKTAPTWKRGLILDHFVRWMLA